MTTYNRHDTKKLDRADLISESDKTTLDKLVKDHKFSGEEYAKLKEILGRVPTFSEVGIFSSMWSEHCSYKSSKVHLARFPTTGKNVVVGPGENAGVVRLHNKMCAAFKMESHNHPSYIEPYQGAATGVGGILRDVFCMGARPVANLNALRFGSFSHQRTAYLVEGVVKGIGDYGNCMGIPTVGGNVSFDPTYNGNCLVNAMTVGVVDEDKIFKGYASGKGNLVVYVGSATGRDGIHGATMASDSFDSAEDSERSAVQVGDPFTEKLLLEATIEVLEKGLVVGLQDMGAAGLTSSSFEMASRAGSGLYMDLDRVPVRTQNMSAYELLLSESQERMVMVIKPENWNELKKVLDHWELASAVIGEVTDTGRVEIHYKGKLEVDVKVDPIVESAPKYERPIKKRVVEKRSVTEFDGSVKKIVESIGPDSLLGTLLKINSEKWPIYQQYDHHIGAKTVRGPEEQGAAVLWIRDELTKDEPYLGLATAASCNEGYCRIDPKEGGAHAVLKSARMIAAAGGEPLAITDCLNFGNPEDPEVMWEFSESVDGITKACNHLDIPVVSGNVSFYNETDGQSIAPTPMIGMVGKVKDVRHCPKAVCEKPSKLYLVYPKNADASYGGSLAAKACGFPPNEGETPKINWDSELESMKFIRESIEAGNIYSARDVGSGGSCLAVAKMAWAEGLSFQIDFAGLEFETEEPLKRYFGEVSGAYVLAIEDDKIAEVLKKAESMNHTAVTHIGEICLKSDVPAPDPDESGDTCESMK